MLLLLILILSLFLQFFCPWWVIAVIAFILSLWRAQSASNAFWSGFAGIGLGWLGASVFIHLRTEGILTGKIAQLFTLPHPILLIIVTALIGGLVGGIAALTGYLSRRTIG